MLNDDTLLVVLILLTMLVIVSAMGGGIRYREDFEAEDEDMSSVGLLLQHSGYAQPAPPVWDEAPRPIPAPAPPPPVAAVDADVTGVAPDALQMASEFASPAPDESVKPPKPASAEPASAEPAAADAAVPDAYFGSEYYPVD